ncbi:acylphosphatase [Candidatus Bathyarchaeota archaeon]|nr:acylphosphatase [Candidatus Bathyarchaeota archaeon]
MVRARIIVEGEVQKVGYRDFVQKVARRLGVKGYVENLRDGNVQVVCEAQEPVLGAFLRGIDVEADLIKVEKIHVAERSAPTGEFEFFEIRYGRLEDELGERLGAAVEYARTTRSSIREMHEDLKGARLDIRAMHEDIKGTRMNIREMHKDIKGTRIDINAMHEDVKGTRLDIKAMHEDIKGTRLDIKEMRADLKESIVNMHADLKGSIEGMHKDLKDGFMGVQSEIRGMRGEMNE